jgi:glucose-1-phosphate cytidylyltransferase
MQVMILAGGLGTRISEESHLKPKPMIEIGGKPILWHIMKHYSHYGFNDFIICCGYKGNTIREWFANYKLYNEPAVKINTNGSQFYWTKPEEDWNVTCVDTGDNSSTGARIKKASIFVTEDIFMLTYGDGVGNIDINKLLDEHYKGKKLVTVTATTPQGRFGSLKLDDLNNAISFGEKKDNKSGELINSGYFVINKKALDYIKEDVMWEQEPMISIVDNNQLHGYHHKGFWQPMDTLRDKNHLEELWKTGNPPWKVW